MYLNLPPLVPDDDNCLVPCRDRVTEPLVTLFDAVLVNQHVQDTLGVHGQALWDRGFFYDDGRAKKRWTTAETALRELALDLTNFYAPFWAWLVRNPHSGWPNLVPAVSLSTMAQVVGDKVVCDYLYEEWYKRWPDVDKHWTRARRTSVVSTSTWDPIHWFRVCDDRRSKRSAMAIDVLAKYQQTPTHPDGVVFAPRTAGRCPRDGPSSGLSPPSRSFISPVVGCGTLRSCLQREIRIRKRRPYMRFNPKTRSSFERGPFGSKYDLGGRREPSKAFWCHVVAE